MGAPPRPSPPSEGHRASRCCLSSSSCTACRSWAWACFSRRSGTRRTWTATRRKLTRAAVSDKCLVRPSIAATVQEAYVSPGQGVPRQSWCWSPTVAGSGRSIPARDTGTDAAGDRRRPGRRLRPREPAACTQGTVPPSGTAARLVTWTRAPGSWAQAWPALPLSRSPSCSPAASPPDPKKTLLFNDSVQDAAHRAGFVASRSYSFSLRTLLAAVLDSYPGRRPR